MKANILLDQRLKELTAAWRDLHPPQFEAIVQRLRLARDYRNAVWVCGNGGSAANALHLSLHLRQCGILAHSLVAETPLLTAISNDESYRHGFADQIKDHARPGDVAVIISGSGNSQNILEVARLARERRIDVLGFLGFGGGQALELCDHAITLSTRSYAVCEDIHSVLAHLVQEAL